MKLIAMHVESHRTETVHVHNAVLRDMFAHTCYGDVTADPTTTCLDQRFGRFLADPTIWGFDVLVGYDPDDRATHRLLAQLRHDEHLRADLETGLHAWCTDPTLTD